MNVDKKWIRKIEVDTINCHLYCCTTTDLYIYDFNGHLMRTYVNCHQFTITACLYSPISKVVLTGSEDSTIKIWSLSGGHIDTFRGHTRAITHLVLNPHYSNLVISSSKDGSIKMWSLDVMQMIYEYVVIYFKKNISIKLCQKKTLFKFKLF